MVVYAQLERDRGGRVRPEGNGPQVSNSWTFDAVWLLWWYMPAKFAVINVKHKQQVHTR